MLGPCCCIRWSCSSFSTFIYIGTKLKFVFKVIMQSYIRFFCLDLSRSCSCNFSGVIRLGWYNRNFFFFREKEEKKKTLRSLKRKGDFVSVEQSILSWHIDRIRRWYFDKMQKYLLTMNTLWRIHGPTSVQSLLWGPGRRWGTVNLLAKNDNHHIAGNINSQSSKLDKYFAKKNLSN